MEIKNIRFKVDKTIFVSVSEAARLTGVNDKTIRRALKSKNSQLKFKIVYDRYQIDLGSLLTYFFKSAKLTNKLNNQGLGQYVMEWQFEKKPSLIVNHKLIMKKNQELEEKETKNHLDS